MLAEVQGGIGVARRAVIGESSDTDPRRERLAYRTFGYVIRFMMLIAVMATFVVAAALLIYGAFETYQLVAELVSGHAPEGRDNVMLEAIEIVDVFLVATVIQVVSIGLYQLYINSRVPLPHWLRITDIEDLKAKLTGVVVTVLGVFFLGEALSWSGEQNLLPLGVAVAVVMVALTFFLTTHYRYHKGKE